MKERNASGLQSRRPNQVAAIQAGDIEGKQNV